MKHFQQKLIIINFSIESLLESNFYRLFFFQKKFQCFLIQIIKIKRIRRFDYSIHLLIYSFRNLVLNLSGYLINYLEQILYEKDYLFYRLIITKIL